MVRLIDRQEPEPWKVRERGAKVVGGVLPETVQKPAVSLGNDSERREPSPRGIGKQTHGGLMMAIRTIEERDEDTAIAEDRPRFHGRGRP
jgi:hypothetical protein